MVNYKDLGLVNTREMFKRAVAGGYAIPAFNFNTHHGADAGYRHGSCRDKVTCYYAGF